MAIPKPKKVQSPEDLLRDLLIVQLGIAGVPQEEIRDIVRADMNRVSKIVKHLKKCNLRIITGDINQILKEIRKDRTYERRKK